MGRMGKIRDLAKNFLREETGMEMVEMTVVAALVIVAGLGIWQFLGDNIKRLLTDLVNYLS